jgi:hypothetical protein
MKGRTHRIAGPLAIALGVTGGPVTACDDPNGTADQAVPLLVVDAFPTQVTPGGEALVTVTVNRACDVASCTVCVGVLPASGSGVVFVAGVAGGAQSVVSISGTAQGANEHVVYKAPAAEGSEIISAWLFDAQVQCLQSATDAGGGASDLEHLVASASVRITIAKASASAEAGTLSDAGASPPSDAPYLTDAGDAADEGG